MLKSALSRNVEKSFRKFPDPDPKAGDFRNSIVHRYLCDFHEVSFGSFYVKLPTDKQTDRQTNAGHYIMSEVDVITFSCARLIGGLL